MSHCSQCRWYRKQENYPSGQCWRYPPVPAFQSDMTHGSGAIHFENLRPYVGWEEFCGEWEQKS